MISSKCDFFLILCAIAVQKQVDARYATDGWHPRPKDYKKADIDESAGVRWLDFRVCPLVSMIRNFLKSSVFFLF
jgi:hypothetical protein